MKTRDLTGRLLDQWVAACTNASATTMPPAYSSDWAECGTLMDQFNIRVGRMEPGEGQDVIRADVCDPQLPIAVVLGTAYGPTYPVAICRAIVASVHGDIVPGIQG